MRMRGIIIAGVAMAVVLLIGTGFSGTVYAKEYNIHKNNSIPFKMVESNALYKYALLKIEKYQFSLQYNKMVFTKMNRDSYWIYIPFKSADAIIGGLSIIYANTTITDIAWGYYDRQVGKISIFNVISGKKEVIYTEHINIKSISEPSVLSSTYYYWWGWKVVLTEYETQTLILGLGAAGASVAAIAALLAWLGIPAGIAGVIAAFLAAGSADIAFIDHLGGNKGVYFSGIWGTNIVWCWHN